MAGWFSGAWFDNSWYAGQWWVGGGVQGVGGGGGLTERDVTLVRRAQREAQRNRRLDHEKILREKVLTEDEEEAIVLLLALGFE